MAFGKVLVASQFKIEVQVKGLTHMFYLWISSHKLYKEYVFPWLLIENAHANLGWVEMHDLECKLQHEWSIFWLFIPSTFSLSYLFAYLHK